MKNRRWSRFAILLGAAAVAALVAVPGVSFFYESTAGETCARCHEIRPMYDLWRASTHRSVGCKECHGSAIFNIQFHLTNVRRVITHVKGEFPEQIGLRYVDVQNMMERCRSCHRQEFADWQASAHSASYQRIFTDVKHNRDRILMDDCLRCHGMHFEGGIDDLVAPINRSGPWRILPAELANMPSVPCLACHVTHRKGQPMPAGRDVPATHHIPAAPLPHLAVLQE